MILQRLSRKLFEYYSRLVFTIYCPVRVHGKENLPEGPYMLCSNHSSHLDFILLAIYSGKGFGHTKIAVARDYWLDHRWRRPLVKWFFEAVPVQRNWVRSSQSSTIQDTVEQFRQALHSRDIIVVFPEGTRTQTGEMKPLKPGAAIIACALGLPIVPAYVSGSLQVWPKGKYLMRPGRMSVRFGKPLMHSCRESKSSDSFKELVGESRLLTAQLHEAIHALGKEANG